jgi:hypothetical protein
MDPQQIQRIVAVFNSEWPRRFDAEIAELTELSNAHYSLPNLTAATTWAELDARQSLRDANHTAFMRQKEILREMLSQASDRPAPPPPVVCGKCHGPIEHPFEFRGVNYCCMQCRHDAGDRRHCRRGVCGCTGFAIKRRQLREHREQMRLMWQVIMACGFEDEVERTMEEDGWPERVWDDAEMDERSDEEDPMVTQANELSNIDSIVQLSRNMVELAGVRRDLKRARDSD